jgi:hypothetical protein
MRKLAASFTLLNPSQNVVKPFFFERNGRKAPEKSAFLITDKHLTKRPTKDKRNTTWSCKSAKKTRGLEAKRDQVLEQHLLPPTPGDPVIYRPSHHTAARDKPLGAERRESAWPALLQKRSSCPTVVESSGMTVAATDKPLEKSSGDDDARLKPAPPRPPQPDQEPPLPLLLSSPPRPARKGAERQQNDLRQRRERRLMQRPHQQGSTPRLPPWQPRQTTCGDLLVLRRDTKRKHSPAPPPSREQQQRTRTPPPRHQGRPGGAERAAAAPTGGSRPYTWRKPRKSRRSLQPSE